MIGMNEKKNFLRAAQFEGPGWIPCLIGIYPNVYKQYQVKLDDAITRYQHLFGLDHGEDEMPWRNENWSGPPYRKGEYINTWGWVWSNLNRGLTGQVFKSPLENGGDSLDYYKIPDPLV